MVNGLTRKIRADEKGVSPVVGVILMVAITVILAAVIASFVFGMGSKIQQVAPQGQFLLEDYPGPVTSEDDDNLILITYVSGDEIPASDLRFVVQYKHGTGYSTKVLTYTGSGAKWTGGKVELISYVNAGRATNVVEPGDQFRLYENGTNWIGSPVPVTVRVIHVPTGSTIFEGTVTVQ